MNETICQIGFAIYGCARSARPDFDGIACGASELCQMVRCWSGWAKGWARVLVGYYLYIVCGAKEVQGVRRVVALRPSGRALGDSARPLVRRARKCCRCVRRVNKCERPREVTTFRDAWTCSTPSRSSGSDDHSPSNSAMDPAICHSRASLPICCRKRHSSHR